MFHKSRHTEVDRFPYLLYCQKVCKESSSDGMSRIFDNCPFVRIKLTIKDLRPLWTLSLKLSRVAAVYATLLLISKKWQSYIKVKFFLETLILIIAVDYAISSYCEVKRQKVCFLSSMQSCEQDKVKCTYVRSLNPFTAALIPFKGSM